MRSSLLVVLAFAYAVAAGTPHHQGGKGNRQPYVRVRNGTYSGVYSAEYDQDFFLGIPYAQPPVEDLRFRIPQSLNSRWRGARNATAYTPTCVGYGGDQIGYEVSEDCLYLNVVRPAGIKRKNLPVAFWIHGGGYFMGSGVDRRYNLTFMVQNGVDIGKPFIGVSINYRLSAWGFLNSEEVQESGQTNLGLRDQRLAMQWVRENIAAFGGDPDKVTIFGESAGASSVGYQLTAYNGRDDKLFRGAIMQSGSPVYYGSVNDTEYFQPLYNSVVNQAGCSGAADTLQCLRDVPYAQLNAVINQTEFRGTFVPAVDGDFFQRLISTQLEDGAFVHVPIISGANSDEGTAFSPQGINTTEIFYQNVVNPSGRFFRRLPEWFGQAILEAYPDIPALGIPGTPPLPADFRPGPPFGAQFRRSAAYYGDATFIAPRRQTCQTWAAAGVAAYCYRFNVIVAGIPAIIGATHFQEVAFVFYNLQGVGYALNPFTNKTEEYTELAKLMTSSWASFVVDQDPNSFRAGGRAFAEVEPWPRYDNGNPQDFVWSVNETSYAEPDTYRAEGMRLINENAEEVYHR
ncbi:hypothetical protein H2201_001863 [Coniosporium apollinis]|uniref:Carboxylic ester hydrolase n=2 Tax=Coniosporium TaxID=2810619 RepID=A0ABQ9P0C5_9PEZI|nr:hypothetical protein H2199_000497 [Cladosporium sp. JES 115]KAJ9668057.1 hypothetical protein H2201_001863 [Coniosporium apollinis]